ncbi:hypothetical protein Pyn_06598 [Prunus yedoensis var. nudiflora]|uniref:Uncharacterized protein n=1 Tax=Prunus yedoensis var. nudiflora TaxID=2094558 RepID=A0A314Y8F6_PRUYE|nr:hypothetical protein Pyn_06598 [Prunus yedoensis var. nudiflora]
MGMKSAGGGGGGGEIIQVQGGHIVRSTGRKDRHSRYTQPKAPETAASGCLPTPPSNSTMFKTASAMTAPAKRLTGSSRKQNPPLTGLLSFLLGTLSLVLQQTMQTPINPIQMKW